MDHQQTYGENKLSRRTVLRAAGVSLSIPWLSAMAPSTAMAARGQQTREEKGEAPKRFVAMSLSLGLVGKNLNPVEAGKNYKPSLYLKPMMDIRDKFTVISGSSHPGVNGGHRAEASILTANSAAPVGLGRNTISIDQLLAKHKGLSTRFPSIVVSTNGSNSPSYTDSGSMIPAEQSPSRLFMQLFVEDSAAERQRQLKRASEGRSILDLVLNDTKKLMGELGKGDKQRLDSYFSSVRDLEKRLKDSEDWAQKPKPKVDAKKPVDIRNGNDLIRRQRLMADTLLLALKTDSTRYISFYLSGGGGVVPVEGVDQGYHSLSHHGKDQEKLSQLALLETEIINAYGDFLRELDKVEESNGSLLDNTAVFMTSNLGDASSHSNRNMPVLIGGGGFRHGQHLAFDKKKNYPLTNLYVSLLQRHGVELDSFVTSTGVMRGLDMI